MVSSELTSLPVSELSTRIQNRVLFPVELTEAFLEHIEKINSDFKLYLNIAPKQARAQALNAEHNLQQGHLTGPLQGIPYAVKDMFLTKDLKTTAGSLVLDDFIPDRDAAVLERLNQEQGILLGKTNQHEFAFGATRENYNWV